MRRGFLWCGEITLYTSRTLFPVQQLEESINNYRWGSASLLYNTETHTRTSRRTQTLMQPYKCSYIHTNTANSTQTPTHAHKHRHRKTRIHEEMQTRALTRLHTCTNVYTRAQTLTKSQKHTKIDKHMHTNANRHAPTWTQTHIFLFSNFISIHSFIPSFLYLLYFQFSCFHLSISFFLCPLNRFPILCGLARSRKSNNLRAASM